MHLYAGIARVYVRRALIAKNQCSSAKAKDVARPLVVRRVETKSLLGTTRGNEGLDQAVWRPRLIATGFHHDGYLESDGRQPQGINRRRVTRHHKTQRFSSGEEAYGRTGLLTKTIVENR